MENEYEFPNANDDKAVPKDAILKKTKIPMQRVIVNGVEQTQYGVGLSLACPDCGRDLFSFPAGTSYEDATQALVQAGDTLYKIAKFCPECGRKLGYCFKEPVDAGGVA